MIIWKILCGTVACVSFFTSVAFGEIQITKSAFDEYVSVITSPYIVVFEENDQEEGFEIAFRFSDFGKENENDVWKSVRQRWEFEIQNKPSELVFIREITVVYFVETQFKKKYEIQNYVTFKLDKVISEQRGVLSFGNKQTANCFVEATKIALYLFDSNGVWYVIEIPEKVHQEWKNAAQAINRKKTAYEKIIEQFQ